MYSTKFRAVSQDYRFALFFQHGIDHIGLDDAELTKLAAELKKKCGCGGAVKDGVIEIQGDKRDLLKSLLEAKGMKVKLAGG